VGILKKTKALVLLSGGQDSTTCLALALNDFPAQVEAIAFDYGQRHKIELEQAKKIAEITNVKLKVLDLKIISELTENALTRPDIKIKSSAASYPSTFVPGRNHLFLSFASVYAREKGIHNIYTGVCQTDYSGYPDCREEFINSLANTLNLAMSYKFNLITPLMHLKKSDSVLMMKALGKLEWYKYTHTCYEGKRPACGLCPACILRLAGFEEAGIKDPLEYSV
jgi:7-cyano-7-deazaguanine synthase